MGSRTVIPEYSYFGIRCDPATSDLITWKLITSRALSDFAGVHGAAIPIDILTVSTRPREAHIEAIIRCPASQADVVSAAISGVTVDGYSMKALKTSSYLAMLV